MQTASPNPMPTQWAVTIGLVILVWASTLVTLAIAIRRYRKAADRERAMLTEAAAYKSHCEQQRDEVSTLLAETQHKLAAERQRCEALLDQVALPRESTVARSTQTTIVQATLPSQPSIEDATTPLRMKELEVSLTEARRARDASDQQVKRLQKINQEQSRKIGEFTAELALVARVSPSSDSVASRRMAELTEQLEDVAVNMQETHITLVERERELLELRRQLADSHGQIEGLKAQIHIDEGQLLEAAARLQVQQDTNSSLNQRLKVAERMATEHQGNSEASSDQLNALIAQLAEKQLAYTALERMLQESTTAQLQLRRDLKTLAQGREDLETQNLELKMILELLGKRTPTVRPARASTQPDEAAFEQRLATAGDWNAVTESDIQSTIRGLAETSVSAPVLLLQPAPSHESVAATDTAPALARELKHAKVRIEMLEANLGDLEYLREQNAKLNEEWTQDHGAARELSALQLEHKRLKLDLQLAIEKVSTQAQDLERLSEIQTELIERNAEKEMVAGLRRQVLDLDVEIFALRNANSGTHRLARNPEGLVSDSRELATFEAAVLSDHLGLPIAATGSMPADSLAAVSGLAARNAEHVRDLLPLGPITTIQWVDQTGKTVTCKLFKLLGDDVIMTTVGSGTPNQQALNRALSSVLSSIGWNEQGPIPDDESRSAAG